jgi:predicted transcriptional regulator
MQVTVPVPDEIEREVARLAAEEGCSVSALYAKAVAQFVEVVRRRRAIARVEQLIGAGHVTPDAVRELGQMRSQADRPR